MTPLALRVITCAHLSRPLHVVQSTRRLALERPAFGQARASDVIGPKTRNAERRRAGVRCETPELAEEQTPSGLVGGPSLPALTQACDDSPVPGAGARQLARSSLLTYGAGQSSLTLSL